MVIKIDGLSREDPSLSALDLLCDAVGKPGVNGFTLTGFSIGERGAGDGYEARLI